MQFIKNVNQHKPSFSGSSKHYNWYICGKEVCANPTQFNFSQRLDSDYRTLVTTYKGGNYRRQWLLYAVFVSRIIFNTRQRDTIEIAIMNTTRGDQTDDVVCLPTQETHQWKKPPINTRDQTDNVNEYCKKHNTKRHNNEKTRENRRRGWKTLNRDVVVK